MTQLNRVMELQNGGAVGAAGRRGGGCSKFVRCAEWFSDDKR